MTRRHPVKAGFGIAALVAAALLAGCGGGEPKQAAGQRGQLASPVALTAATYRAPGLPSGFGDLKPHSWQGLSPDRYPVHGVDAARYQGAIDWHPARDAGVGFAWLKATEGGDRVDPGFETNAPRARAAGVPVGAYHFYYFCRSAEDQADWFIANVPRVRGDLPPVLDMEWNHLSPSCKHRPDAETVRSSIAAFSRKVERHYGTAPVIYTTPDFYSENRLDLLDGYEFWLRAVTMHPSERYPGERWTFWQYTGTGVVPGVGGHVDLNAFAGDHRAWRGWLEARTQR